MKQLFAVLSLLVLLCLPVMAEAKIILADTDDTLQVITASGVTTVFMYASWADITTTALTPGASDAQVTSATTTTLVAAPGASTQRQVKGITIRNSHASSSNAITVQFYDGATATELVKYTLLAGETLQWNEDSGFKVMDASGQIKAVVTADTEMPAAAALADNTANPTVPAVAAYLMCYDGSTWDRCQGGLTDTDDGTIAGAQVPNLVVNLGYVYDGTNWVRNRLTVGVEDAAETAGGGLAMAGTVRRDTAASSAGTDGDNATLNTDATGRLWTHVGAVDGNVTVTATNLDVQSGGADLLTETTGAAILTSTNFAAAFGTAGTPDSQVMSVQGVTSMTPLLSNPGTAANWGVYAEDTADADGNNLVPAGAVRRNAAASSTSTDGDRATINTDTLGLLWTRQLDPCSGVAKTYYPVSISTATTTEIVNGAGASNYFYVCAIILHTDAANDVALVEDDTDACASPTAGIMGGTTTGTGFQFTAGGGFVAGNGQGSVARSANANYYICLITSAATQLTGHIVYALAP